MRLYEVHGFANLPTEEMILEGWLDSVKKTLGDKTDQAVKVVNNTATALQVFYKIGTNPKYLDTIVTLLKKDIRTKLKGLGNGPLMTKLREFISKLIPEGNKLLDFVKACIVCAVLKFASGLVDKFNSAKKIGQAAIENAKDAASEVVSGLIQKMTGLDAMISGLSQASGIFAILKSLGVANELLFEILGKLNHKIENPFA